MNFSHRGKSRDLCDQAPKRLIKRKVCLFILKNTVLLQSGKPIMPILSLQVETWETTFKSKDCLGSWNQKKRMNDSNVYVIKY